MRKFNVGVIGAGIIAKNHLEAAEKILDISLRCICDIVFERAEAFGKEYGITPYADYRQMMDIEELDIVIIALPVFLHHQVAMEAIARKINVLLEKPMAASVNECMEMIATAQENNVKLMLCHMQRYMPENRKAFEIMKSGDLGKLVMINDKRYYNYFNEKRPNWALKKETAGGGVMLNLGAHSIDKLLFMTESRVKKVVGKCGYYSGNLDVEGCGQMFLEMENGISAVITHTGYNAQFECETEYIFTNGIMKVHYPSKIRVVTNNRSYEEEIIYFDPFEQLLHEIMASISEDREPKVSGEYGLDVVKAITMLYECTKNI